MVGQGARAGRAVHYRSQSRRTRGPFLRRKFGGAAYRALLGPLYGGLYASDPDRMPVKHALQRTLVELGVRKSILWRMFRGAGRAAETALCSFQGGLGALPLAITRKLEGSVRLETPVCMLRRKTDRWEVTVNGAGIVPVDTVVLACPPMRPQASWGARIRRRRPGCRLFGTTVSPSYTSSLKRDSVGSVSR